MIGGIIFQKIRAGHRSPAEFATVFAEKEFDRIADVIHTESPGWSLVFPVNPMPVAVAAALVEILAPLGITGAVEFVAARAQDRPA